MVLRQMITLQHRYILNKLNEVLHSNTRSYINTGKEQLLCYMQLLINVRHSNSVFPTRYRKVRELHLVSIDLAIV